MKTPMTLEKRIVAYLDEKIAIGIIKYWDKDDEVRPLEAPTKFYIRVTPIIWERVMRDTLCHLIDDYTDGVYCLKWDRYSAVSGVTVVSWKLNSDV